MQPYQNYFTPQMPGYNQQFQTPYSDRLNQLQNQYQQIVSPQNQPQQVNQGLLWVQGEAGAKSYLVAPNTTVLLMDSESQRFYLKSTDGAGMPSMRMFEYSEVSQNAPQGLNSNEINLDGKYVTREEYEGLKRQYESLMEKLDNISVNSDIQKPKPKTKGGSANEQSDI